HHTIASVQHTLLDTLDLHSFPTRRSSDLGGSRLPFFGCYVPRNPLQVQDKDRVEDWHQEQGDKGGDGEAANLGIAERLPERATLDRKSTRLNSSHDQISYAVFCLKKKND